MPKEPQAGGRGDAETGGDIHTDRHRCDEVLAADALPPLRPRHRDRQHHADGVNDGLLVNGVKLRVVHLIGIAHGRRRRRQVLAEPPDTSGAALSPGLLSLGKITGHRPRAPAYADAQRIQHEDLGGSHGLAREIRKPRSHRMVGKGSDGIHAKPPSLRSPRNRMRGRTLATTTRGQGSLRQGAYTAAPAADPLRRRVGRLGPRQQFDPQSFRPLQIVELKGLIAGPRARHEPIAHSHPDA